MWDLELYQLIRVILLTGLTSRSLAGVKVELANQPTQQGANLGSTIYFFKVSDVRFGWVQRKDEWDEDSQTIIHTETQQFESLFQINALSILNPAVLVQLTASDLVNIAADVMQSTDTLEALEAVNIGILPIREIRNPYIVDDRDRFEASPSFDFTLTHKRSTVSISKIINRINSGIYPI